MCLSGTGRERARRKGARPRSAPAAVGRRRSPPRRRSRSANRFLPPRRGVSAPPPQEPSALEGRADSLDARVDLEVHAGAGRAGGGRLFNVAEPSEGGHGQGEAMVEKERDLPRPYSAEHQHGVRMPSRRSAIPSSTRATPKASAAGRGASHRLEAVAVRVGLQDRHDPGGGDVLLHRAEVVAEARAATTA